MTDLENLKSQVCCHWTKLYWLAKCGDSEGICQEGWGSGHCAFCRVYLQPGMPPRCDGCPIKEATGQDDCKGTPYTEARGILLEIVCRGLDPGIDLTPIWREVVFLHDLPLPKEEG